MWVQWTATMLGWLLGVGVQLQQATVDDVRWAWAGPAAVLAALLWRWRAGAAPPGAPVWPRQAVVCLLAALLGWSQAQWRAADRVAQVWPPGWDHRTVMLTGRIDALPQVQGWGQRLEVRVLSVDPGPGLPVRQAGQRWRLPGLPPQAACPERVSLGWTPSEAVAASLRPGQVWRWPARLVSPHGLSNPGGFDAEQWLFQRGLRAQGKVMTAPGAPPALLLRPARWWSANGVDQARAALRARVRQHLPDERVAGLVIGLTIGDQSAIGAGDWDAMRATGTAHLAAISGLHITMMGWALAGLTGLLWRRSWRLMHWVSAPTAARLGGLAGAWLYALMAGWGVPAQRTVLMLAVVTALRLSSRRWPWPMVLLAAAVAVTLLDPWALTQVGFWLSFAAVGLLMLSGRPQGHASEDRWWRRLGRAAREGMRTQWIASLGLAPLSLVFFHQVSLVGLLANLVCIPVFTLVITPLALLGLAWPGLWTVLVSLAPFTLDGLAALGQWHWATWSSAEVLPWASALGLLAGAWMLAPLPWRWRLMALPALCPLLWSTSWSQPWPPPPAGHMQVLAVDIGQGTAVLVRTAGHALLYDTGPRTSPDSDAGERVLAGLLRALGVHGLDLLMVSHGDIDHVGGAASVLKAVPVQSLSSSLEEGHALLDQPGRSGQPPPHTPCQAGQRWTWDGVAFEVLHPSRRDWARRQSLSDNGMSCVLRVRSAQGGRGILLAGDIEAAQEAELAGQLGQGLRSEVLMVPHHGSHTSSTPPWLEAVRPEVAVIQAGARNRYGHPHIDVVRRYDEAGVALVQTAHCGAWLWRSDSGPARQAGRCWRDVARRYWHAPPRP